MYKEWRKGKGTFQQPAHDPRQATRYSQYGLGTDVGSLTNWSGQGVLPKDVMLKSKTEG